MLKNRPAALVIVEDIEGVGLSRSSDLDIETPETTPIAKTDARRLEGAIAALPAPFRETLVLRDVHGLSYREIAEVTGAPAGTVMSRLARGAAR
jgi:RNA polymerase sigma factor (sigma-70 family)